MYMNIVIYVIIVVFIFALIYPQPQVDQLAFDPLCCVQVEWRHSRVQYIYSTVAIKPTVKSSYMSYVMLFHEDSCYSFIISTNKLVELPISQII
jgi:hypothetical protein